jgi:ribosomal protein L40E
MELEKYKEITKWFHDNFEEEQPLNKMIIDYYDKVFQKLPSDYMMEYVNNPELVLVNEEVEASDSNEPQKVQTLLNPFFSMFIVLSCKATYDAVMREINKDKKICSDCKKENPNEAKYCMECGSKF